VHIINRSYVVMPDNSQSSSILITEPGAIIKVAGEFKVDQNGKLVSWQSPWYEAKLSAGLSGYIKLIGATITCIEDDTEGVIQMKTVVRVLHGHGGLSPCPEVLKKLFKITRLNTV